VPIAIVAADGVFTYDDLDAISGRVAAALAHGGDLREARVAFLVPPTFAYVAIQRGIWRAGGVAVPLAVSHPPAELDYVIRDSAASIVIASGTQAAALEGIAASAGARYMRAADLLAADDEDPPAVELTPNRRAMIVYTSGTTGRPKGVVTTHGNVAAQIESLVTAWEWSARDTALLVLPLHHVHGIVNVLGCAIASRAACEILPQFDPESAWARLASGEVTVFSAVPTIYRRLIASWDAAPAVVQRERSAACRRLRLMMSGSAALPVTVLERWREISGHTLLERYGMTEIGMALSNPLHGARRPGFVGTPLPGVEVRIVDEHGQVLAGAAAGELEVRGPGVFLEYWHRPEETRAAFHEGWFRTGDVAAMERGAYRLLGRSSTDIIKSGGYKISALEIEEVLRMHDAVRDCAVVGVPDEEWGERVVAALELHEGRVATEELREWAKQRLAPYKVPKELRKVDALPRNAMGKVTKIDVARLFR
jgi:malonyl-CoA/methylmalonyl-CoA synthetase